LVFASRPLVPPTPPTQAHTPRTPTQPFTLTIHSYTHTCQAREIVDEVVFNRRTRITDAAELEESRQSLKRALASFMHALKPPLPAAEVARRADALDMSLATRKFEADISSGGTAAYHLVTGEMARVLLLQVLFIKKELLVAMSAIEDLMDANNFNFRELQLQFNF